MSKNLQYTEFRTASYRNLNVCKHLIEKFDQCKPSNKQQVLHNIYYLSGYIIEFCYKYALFSKLTVERSQNVYSVNDEKFQKKWREHNFNRLNDLCTEYNIIFSEDIPFFGSKIKNKELNCLFQGWDVQIRYSLTLTNQKVILSEKIIKELIELLEIILTKITSRFQ